MALSLGSDPRELWIAINAMVKAAGTGDLSPGDTEPEFYRKIKKAAIALGFSISDGMTREQFLDVIVAASNGGVYLDPSVIPGTGGGVPILLTNPDGSVAFAAQVGVNYVLNLPAYTGGTDPVTIQRRGGNLGSKGTIDSAARTFSLSAAELNAPARIKFPFFDYTGAFTGELATFGERSTIASALNFLPVDGGSISLGVSSSNGAALTAARETNNASRLGLNAPQGLAGRVRLAITSAYEKSNVDTNSTIVVNGKPNKQRAELRWDAAVPTGQEYWISDSAFRVGGNRPAYVVGNWNILEQLLSPAQAGEFFSPPLSIEEYNDGLYVFLRTSTQSFITDPTPTTVYGPFRFLPEDWASRVIGFKAAQDGTGWVEVYVAGALLFSARNINFGYPGKTLGVKTGIYTGRAASADYGAWHDDTGVQYIEIANMEMGTGVLRDRARNPKPIAGFSAGPVLIDSAKVAADYSNINGLTAKPTADTDPTHSLDGGGIRMESNGVVGNFVTRKPLGTVTLADKEFFVTWYQVDQPRISGTLATAVYLPGTNKVHGAPLASKKQTNVLPKGLYPHIQPIAELVDNTSAQLPAGPITAQLQLTMDTTGSFAGRATASSISGKVVKRPSPLMLTFDDNVESIRTVLAPAMAARGLVGTAFIIPDLIHGLNGYNNPAKMSAQQILELYTIFGWDIGLGAPGDLCWSGFGSLQAIADGVALARSTAIGIGLPMSHPGLEMSCWSGTGIPTAPAGHGASMYDISGNINTVAAITSDGSSPTVTFGAANANIAIGMSLKMAGVPDGVTVTAVGSSASVTLSAPIPAGTKAGAFIDESHPFYLGKIQKRLKDSGIKFCRGSPGMLGSGRNSVYTAQGMGDHDVMFPSIPFAGQTGANVIASINASAANLESMPLAGHGTTGFLAMAEAEAMIMLDGIVSLKNAGVVNDMRCSDFYRLDGAKSVPLYVS